jgi:hypothetical protein
MGPGKSAMEDSVLTLIFSGHWPFQLPETCVCHSHQRPTECRNPHPLFLRARAMRRQAAKEEKALSTQMSPRVARDLAICLWLAADEGGLCGKSKAALAETPERAPTSYGWRGD